MVERSVLQVIDSVINSKGISHLNKVQKPLNSVYIPYVKGVSGKFKCIGNQYNIKTIFKTKHIFRSSLMKTRLERDPRQTAQCICSIPCECGRSYIGETGRPLTVRLGEHRPNLQQSSRKIKISPTCLWRESQIGWDDARTLEIESNRRYRKYKESANMECLTNPNSQPSLDFSPIWISITSNEVSNSQRRSVWHDRFFMGFQVSVLSVQVLLHRWH
jgi:hypothetical protein